MHTHAHMSPGIPCVHSCMHLRKFSWRWRYYANTLSAQLGQPIAIVEWQLALRMRLYWMLRDFTGTQQSNTLPITHRLWAVSRRVGFKTNL